MYNFFYNFFNFADFFFIFFAVIPCRCPIALPLTLLAGVSQRFGRELKMLFRTAARTSCSPACGKTKLQAGLFCYSHPFQLAYTSLLLK